MMNKNSFVLLFGSILVFIRNSLFANDYLFYLFLLFQWRC